MLDPQSIKFDKYNVWRELWYIPTDRELYIINNDGAVVAKWCLIKRSGEWPMWIFKCIVNILPMNKLEASRMIVKAWETQVLDQLVDIDMESSHRRSAILDN